MDFFLIFIFVHLQVLFDPHDDRIIDRQLINAIRDKYIILMRHYLQSVYSYAHAEKYMLALEENLLAIRTLNAIGKPMVKLFFPSIPNKLLVEILDLD
jgi:nuclear receptor subfamily 1 group I